MRKYSEFAPTGYDTKGLNLPDQQDWLVHPCGTNRDANALTRSNFRVACRDLDRVDPTNKHHEVVRFGHWACGWFEIIIVRHSANAAAYLASQHEDRLEDYPALNEDDWSEEEQREADETWTNCYSNRQRVEYIREHREEFEFRSFADMLACARGKYYAGSTDRMVQS